MAAAGSGLALRTGGDLVAALDDGLLTVLYQPVFDTRTGHLVAAEALARLRDPVSGALLPPSDFVPLAESTGLVGRLDQLVAAIALPQTVTWRALRPGLPFSVGVNVSAGELEDPTLPDRMAELCVQSGLPFNALVVEVTETALSTPGPVPREVLHRLSSLEVNVTLDDFGTGFSSLTHLLRFPICGIKIDRSFVQELGTAGRGARIAAAVVRLGADVGVHVVAEGVELPEQLAALRDLGCPFAQGYLLGRPMPAEQFTALVAQPRCGLPRPRLARGS